MKNILFNDRYGLTQAVIEGRKDMTRRIMNTRSGNLAGCIWFTKKGRRGIYMKAIDNGISKVSSYAIGEVVAVAQSYEKAKLDPEHIILTDWGCVDAQNTAGWNNKMFVKPELMPRKIRIIGIKCERLQDISDEDCMKEGIRYIPEIDKFYFEDVRRDESFYFETSRQAFASLIDKVSGRGTWERNPRVFVYEFALVK